MEVDSANLVTRAELVRHQPSTSTDQAILASIPRDESPRLPKTLGAARNDCIDLTRQRRPQQSVLPRLPTHILEIIFIHLLRSVVSIRWPSAKFDHGLTPAVLQTCAPLYQVACPILYRKNVFDFCQPSDVTVFRSIMDAHNATKITEATFRIRDRNFDKVWRGYFKSEDPDRSFRADLPNLKRLVVVLLGSWWNPHLDAEENFKDWHRMREFRDLGCLLANIAGVEATIIHRVRVPRDHFEILKRTHTLPGQHESATVLRCIDETRLQTPARKIYNKYDCFLELLSPDDASRIH